MRNAEINEQCEIQVVRKFTRKEEKNGLTPFLRLIKIARGR